MRRKIKWALALLPAPTASEFGFRGHKDHKLLCLTSGSPISPEGFLGLPRYFGYPIRRCVTFVSPHMIFVFFVPTKLITFPVLRQIAYHFSDLAFPFLNSASRFRSCFVSKRSCLMA